MKSDIQWNNRLPSKMATYQTGTTANFRSFQDNDVMHEEFKYDGNNITSFRSYVHGEVPIRKEVNGKTQFVGSEVKDHNDNTFNYEYSGDLLHKVSDDRVTYEFEYEGTQLIASKYILNGKVYNTRKYFYTDSGLKERTEIFNVYGDAEYTIHYHYDFYES